MLEKIGHISGPSADGGFEGVTLISAPFADGRRIAIIPWLASPRPVLVVNPDGTVTDTLATNGEGPGQVAHPVWTILGLGDTTLMIDRGRIHIFAPDHHYVRSIPSAYGGVWSAAQAPNGDILLASSGVGGREEVVAALSPVDGTRRWSIVGPKFDREVIPGNRFVAVAPDSTVWTVAAWGHYQLEQYSADGKLLRTLTPAASWFPPYDRQRNWSKNSAPNTDITGFFVDSLDRAWVVAQAADPAWASAEGTVQRSEGQEYFQPKSWNAVRDGIIDVIDLRSGLSIATWRRDFVFGPIAEPGVMYHWRTNEDGWTQIDLYRLSLRSTN